MHLRILLSAIGIAGLIALVSSGCNDDNANPTGTGGGEAGANQGGGPPDLPPTSAKALLKLKAGLRFRNDVAQTLDLDVGYCSELGLVECSAVHYIVMGGADALFSGVYQPLPDTTATSPLAFDRMAMAGCIQRADLDIGGGEKVIFAALPIDQENRLGDPASPAVAKAITTLYHRALGRDPSEGETAALTGLYGEIEAKGGDQPARDWAVLTCFSVMTTMENVFY